MEARKLFDSSRCCSFEFSKGQSCAGAHLKSTVAIPLERNQTKVAQEVEDLSADNVE